MKYAKSHRGIEAIKGVLREELQSSLRMKISYEKALADLPKGALVKKRIRGHDYYYILYREGQKVKHAYKGKLSEVPAEEIAECERAKRLRAQYRHLLAEVNAQIRYLKGILREPA